MRYPCLLVFLLILIGTAGAFDLGQRAPAKPARTTTPPPPDPAVLRQGGDTILDAVLVEINQPDLAGTTVGYNNDYDEVCPYAGSTSPDVVYTFVPAYDTSVDIDLYGSAYDTKVYLYDADLNLIDCNDDFYPDYTSKIEQAPVVAGMSYYVIIDGYGGDAGDYQLVITNWPGVIVIECPADGVEEGEPPLVDGYLDAWNGGCNSPEFGNPFQAITEPVFCGVSGWYVNDQGGQSRDTDWFEIAIPEGGVLEVVGDAELATYMFELGPRDCEQVGVIQVVEIVPGMSGELLSITGTPGDVVWFWVGPTTFDGDGEYNYLLELNIEGTTAVRNQSWSGVKALFR